MAAKRIVQFGIFLGMTLVLAGVASTFSSGSAGAASGPADVVVVNGGKQPIPVVAANPAADLAPTIELLRKHEL